MRALGYLLQICTALLVGVLLTGCPHHLERAIEEALPPEGYRPVYLTSTIPIDSVAGAGGSIEPLDLDSLRADPRAGDTATGQDQSHAAPDRWHNVAQRIRASSTGAIDTIYYRSPISFELREIDARLYPDAVRVRAFVYDTAGRSITGLADPYLAPGVSADRFWLELHDSCAGMSHRISSFSVREIREESREPHAISIVLDHSSSMGTGRVERLRSVIGELLRAIHKEDWVSVLTFNSETLLEVPLTWDKRVWVPAFRPSDLSSYGGGTSLYDAALEGIAQLRRAPDDVNRAMILFTDGDDGNSDSTLSAVHRAARSAGVRIYTIAYGMADEEELYGLAHYTGGRLYRIYSTGEFRFVFRDIYRRLSNYYEIVYAAPECAALHTVRSVISLPSAGIDRLSAIGTYDQSLFTPFDEPGEVAFLNIEFAYDRAEVESSSISLLRDVAEAMKRYPSMVIEIRGHTDDRGSESYNLDLSRRRAEAVARELERMGIEPERLKTVGYGESRPLVPNDDEESRRENRRTEFVILKR